MKEQDPPAQSFASLCKHLVRVAPRGLFQWFWLVVFCFLRETWRSSELVQNTKANLFPCAHEGKLWNLLTSRSADPAKGYFLNRPPMKGQKHTYTCVGHQCCHFQMWFPYISNHLFFSFGSDKYHWTTSLGRGLGVWLPRDKVSNTWF